MAEKTNNNDQPQRVIAEYEKEMSLCDSAKDQAVLRRQLDRILDSLPHPFYVINARDYSIVLANQAALGGKEKEARHTCHELTHHQATPCFSMQHPCPLEIVKESGAPTIVEHLHYDCKGEPRFVEVHAFPIFDEQGKVVEMIEYCLDITRRKEAEDRLDFLANHDPLTGLPNRNLFNIRLQLEMEHAVREKNRVAVMLLDLDGFKLINDTFGHDAGDEVLRAVASRLEAVLRKSDTAARLGGDEFLVLIPGLSSLEAAGAMARKMIKALDASLVIQGKEMNLKGSLGIAIFPDDADQLDTLIKFADMAMYSFKGQGGGGYRFYGDSGESRLE